MPVSSALGAVTQCPVLVQGGMPEGSGMARTARRTGSLMAYRTEKKGGDRAEHLALVPHHSPLQVAVRERRNPRPERGLGDLATAGPGQAELLLSGVLGRYVLR
ncbi:hypothetical protein EES46_16775 [Streptomyces sp. ADI98-10]|nr:hypothetical protein EES46_16775 [Streptomyces sp. ADI98-10]